MIHSLIPWTRLTTGGTDIPLEFRVIRRSLAIGEKTFAPGDMLRAEDFAPSVRRARLRQYYNQRRIEPAEAPPNSKQAHRRQTPNATPLSTAGIDIQTVGPVIEYSIPSVEIPMDVAEVEEGDFPSPTTIEPYSSARKSSRRR